MRHVVTNELRSFDILYLGGREADEGACLWEQGLEVDSPSLPKPHELNHAYAYLRKQREPIPFLAEGIAEAIACGTDVPATIDDVPWESVVAEPGTSNEIYTQGGALVRHLIRAHGIEAFLRYYEQSPEQRDPALFAANFQSFWNTTLDEVWTDLHPAAGMISEGDTRSPERHLTLGTSIPPAGSAATVYLDLASSFSGVLWFVLEEICNSCGFDQGTCQPISPGATPDAQVTAAVSLRRRRRSDGRDRRRHADGEHRHELGLGSLGARRDWPAFRPELVSRSHGPPDLLSLWLGHPAAVRRVGRSPAGVAGDVYPSGRRGCRSL